MILIHCKMCKCEIDKQAALVWSPPDKHDYCKKFHICRKCWKVLKAFITKKD